jgi:hypothetical protein
MKLVGELREGWHSANRLAQREQGPQSDAEVYHIDIKIKGCRGGPANVTSKSIIEIDFEV